MGTEIFNLFFVSILLEKPLRNELLLVYCISVLVAIAKNRLLQLPSSIQFFCPDRIRQGKTILFLQFTFDNSQICFHTISDNIPRVAYGIKGIASSNSCGY
jgi:hypothetical protein